MSVKLRIMGGVEGLKGLRRWLLGDPVLSPERGRLVDLWVEPSITSAEPVMTRLVGGVERTGRVLVISVWRRDMLIAVSLL